MGIKDTIKNQLRSIIQWEDPQPFQIFHRFTNRGDELKNASKLIIQPGQGCIFTYEGKIEGIFQEEGMYNLKTDNKPFITTLKKLMNAFESEHKVGLWFFKNNDITNIRWGTRIPITYNDPVYSFPVNLRGFGNYSIKIDNAKAFFTNIVGGMKDYYCAELQELFLSRITQPISNYLANAKFSYAEIDANIETIAKDAQEKIDALKKVLEKEDATKEDIEKTTEPLNEVMMAIGQKIYSAEAEATPEDDGVKVKKKDEDDTEEVEAEEEK